MTKSTLVAVFLSIIFPGLGLLYIGDKNNAGLFFLLTVAGVIIWPLLVFWPSSILVTYIKAEKIKVT